MFVAPAARAVFSPANVGNNKAPSGPSVAVGLVVFSPSTVAIQVTCIAT